MAAATVTRRCRSLADLLKKLGDIPPERIGLPVGTATEEDVLRHLEAPNKRIYELVDGILVEKPLGMRESVIASFLVHLLWAFVAPRNLGVVFAPDGPIRVRKGRIRFPDTGFISWDRIPGGEIGDEPIIDGVPELIVEVLSKSNTPQEMAFKIKEYFRLGVELAWIVQPRTRSIRVYSSPERSTLLREGDYLDGGEVLPGFRVKVGTLFENLKRRK